MAHLKTTLALLGRARLLLRQSEFEFLRSVQLKLCKLLQKNENKLDSS